MSVNWVKVKVRAASRSDLCAGHSMSYKLPGFPWFVPLFLLGNGVQAECEASGYLPRISRCPTDESQYSIFRNHSHVCNTCTGHQPDYLFMSHGEKLYLVHLFGSHLGAMVFKKGRLLWGLASQTEPKNKKKRFCFSCGTGGTVQSLLQSRATELAQSKPRQGQKVSVHRGEVLSPITPFQSALCSFGSTGEVDYCSLYSNITSLGVSKLLGLWRAGDTEKA